MRSSDDNRYSLEDSYGRRISYLRISVTDRCNLSCRYCKPTPAPSRNRVFKSVLSFENIARITRIFARLGTRKLRLTGGEPLLRRDLPILIRMLSTIEGVDDISITTNGVDMPRQAGELRDSGISGVNIHIDSLNPSTYRWITGNGSLSEATEGIMSSIAAGFKSVKLNTVLMRGVNEGEIFDLIEFASKLNIPIRFIELMPMGNRSFFDRHFISADEVSIILKERWTLTPIDYAQNQGPARYFNVNELGAQIGFISHRSRSFCHLCNRVRLLSDGTVKSCLGGTSELRLGELIQTMSNSELAMAIRSYMISKPIDHFGFKMMDEDRRTPMYAIGG